MSHAHPGGQAPDQASSGRQTGAAAHTRTDHSQGTQSGQSLDESHAARQQPGWQRSQTDQHAESYRHQSRNSASGSPGGLRSRSGRASRGEE
jgi:hypothetical protein